MKFRTWAALVAVLVLTPRLVSGQPIAPSPQGISAVSSGITVCTAGNCAVWTSIQTAPSVTAQITGTLTSLTLTFEATSTGNVDDWVAVPTVKVGTGVSSTTTTSSGQYAFLNTGFVGFRVRCTTFASGGANVSLTRGLASNVAKLFDLSNVTGTLGPTHGGTGFASYAVGDLLYADTTTSLAKRAAVATGQVLASAGTSTAPVWTGTPLLTGGAGTTKYHVAGMLTTPVSTQIPSTADTNFVCVSLGTITANTLNAAGDTIELISDWERSAAAATITLTVNIGGTCVADATGFTGGVNIVSTTNLGTVSIAYDAHVWVQRGASATTTRTREWMVRTGNTTAGSATSSASSAIDWGASNTIGLAFKTSASGATDVKLNTARVMFTPAP